jgi:predicted flap endonuclease-1-like 5' DNA nuclease
MFEAWLKVWWQWWLGRLPDSDAPATSEPARPAQRQPATSDPEAADVDAVATWRPDAPTVSAQPDDDLTAIPGIGPATARKLDELGVETFADLAAADPDDLVERIARRPVTARHVQEWVAEAKKRVA